jgi:glycosyltransferase involved in cell wall biosynthesis
MTTTLCILTLNEIEAMKYLIKSIPLKEAEEVFVIDGGSTDGTIEFLRSQGLSVYIQKEKGRGRGFIEGISRSTKDAIIFFSGDGNERAADISKVREKLEEGYDLVIASRFRKDSHSFDATPIRKFGNKLFTLLVNACLFRRFSDVFNGFRGIRRDKALALNLDAYYFNIELQMVIRAAKRGFKIAEVSTIEDRRIGGKAHLKTFRDGFSNLRCFLKEIIK